LEEKAEIKPKVEPGPKKYKGTNSTDATSTDATSNDTTRNPGDSPERQAAPQDPEIRR
jgi:hypothetical protein